MALPLMLFGMSSLSDANKTIGPSAPPMMETAAEEPASRPIALAIGYVSMVPASESVAECECVYRLQKIYLHIFHQVIDGWKRGIDDQISCLVIFKEQDTGTVKKLFEAFGILSSPGKLFAGPYIVYYICFYDPICIGGLYVPAFKGWLGMAVSSFLLITPTIYPIEKMVSMNRGGIGGIWTISLPRGSTLSRLICEYLIFTKSSQNN